MEILKKSNVNWNRVLKCPKCYSVFSITEEDIEVWFDMEKMLTTRITICPECWERMVVDLEWILNPKKGAK